MSERAQAILLWWTIAFAVIFGTAWVLLIKTVPLPQATQTAQQVAAFYKANSYSIRWGAVICGWTSAFVIPFSVVLAVQIARLERGVPVWGILACGAGIASTIFVAFPMMLFGVAAYDPGRPAEITAALHQIAILTLVTSDQFFVFQFVALSFVSLTQKVDAHSPFPRWVGYLSIWWTITAEAGAFAFIPKTGPFAWNGLFPFWIPFGGFSILSSTLLVLLFRALKRQRADA